MTPSQLSTAYDRVAKAHQLPALKPARCQIETQVLSEPSDGFTQLQGQAPQQGWLQFQSRVVAFTAGELPQPAPDWGVLLAAEVVDADGRSIHLRQSGDSGWLLVVCIPDNQTTAEITPANGLVLADEVTQLATDQALGSLRYRRYWQLDPETGATPAFAAFIGFGPTEEH